MENRMKNKWTIKEYIDNKSVGKVYCYTDPANNHN